MLQTTFDFPETKVSTTKKRQHRSTSKEAHESVKYFKEIWKDIIGYEGRYMISNKGQVKSLPRKVNRNNSVQITKEIIKKLRINKSGYNTAYLAIIKSYRHFMVHRLVAIAFIPNKENKPFINHIDGNKLNNHVDNLEWCTSSENIKHAYKNGLMSQKGENHASNKLNNKQVLDIFKSTQSSRLLSKKYGVNQNSINNIKTGVTWSHITGNKYKKQTL